MSTTLERTVHPFSPCAQIEAGRRRKDLPTLQPPSRGRLSRYYRGRLFFFFGSQIKEREEEEKGQKAFV